MTPTKDNTLPPWMIDILTKEEKEKIEELAQIPLHIPLPMSREQVVEESDIIEEEGNTRSTVVEVDIS